jgi:hypothetical protein
MLEVDLFVENLKAMELLVKGILGHYEIAKELD